MLENQHDTRLRPFDFARDTFGFENETLWKYYFDPASGGTTFGPRVPKPSYCHRCFVLTKAARQFFYHVRFEPGQSAPEDAACRRLIRQTVGRHPRRPTPGEKKIVIPGYASLREFSAARAPLLKAECGGAWRSYVMRSHWRMVYPISRLHQVNTSASMLTALRRHAPPIIHLVKFPALTINHSMLLFAVTEKGGRLEFQAYDPNNPNQPVTLSFDPETRGFSLPPNHYWAGGGLDIIEICRNWWM